MATPAPEKKAIHSLVLDTGPLIRNTVSISTMISSAEEIYTTPAIISEIRDEATRSRVQTTLIPFLKIRNPSPKSYDAVIAFSKKTGDYPVLSRQDLGVLALAYELHCEQNGGNFGLRQVPKGPIMMREGEEEVEENETKEKEPKEKEPKEKKRRNRRNKVAVKSGQEDAPKVPAEEEGWEQPKGKRATTVKAVKPTKFKYEVAKDSTTEESQAQRPTDENIVGEAIEERGGVATPDAVKEQEPSEQIVADAKPVPETPSDSIIVPAASENTIEEPQPTDAAADSLAKQLQETTISPSVAQEAQYPTTEQQPEDPNSGREYEEIYDATDSEPEGIATAEEIAAHNTANPLPLPPKFTTQQLTPPHTDADSDSDSEGSWITPSNLPTHQAKDGTIPSSARTAPTQQLPLATMTTDYALQNVLLQLNLALLSPALQRIKTITSKVLRCHACFLITHDVSKSFCPRCGQATLARVSCSTTARGEFRIHLARSYQVNKRGDRFSVPKPVAGTANGKWNGVGGGKGGWGRELVFAEDQKEFLRGVREGERESRRKVDEDVLPALLTGERRRGGARVRVGAGRDVNSRKR